MSPKKKKKNGVSKHFESKKILVQKNSGPKTNLRDPKISGPKKMLVKKIWPKENFSQKEIWVNTNFETETILCPGFKKNLGSKKIFSLKKIWGLKIFWAQETFWIEKTFDGLKQICVQNLFV